MSAHLTPEQVLAVAEGQARTTRVERHLAGCETCRHDVDAVRETQAGVREVEVPEPSPLFWEQFSARVARAVREPVEQARLAGPGGWRRLAWAGWGWTLGGAALTAALLAVAFVPRGATPVPEGTTTEAPVAPEPAFEATPLAEEGEDWAWLADAAGSLDYDEVRALGAVAPPGAVELAVQDLDADEQRELARLLQEAIAHARQPAGASETL